MFEILGLHALWGSSLPMSKNLLSYTSPTVLTAVRMIASGALLFAINYVRNRTSFAWNKTFWWYNGQIVIAIFLKYQLRNWSLSNMPASKMSFTLNIAPFVVALFAYFAFGDRLTRLQWIGLVIGFIGMIPLIITSSAAEQKLGEFLYISWPEIAIFAAVCVDAYIAILSRILIREHNQSIVLSNGIRMLGAGIIALGTIFIMDIPFEIKDFNQFVGWMALLILVANVICHNYRLYLLKYYSVTFLAFTDFLSPLFTAFYSWLFLKEILTWHYAVSAIVVFIGLYLFYQDELKVIYRDRVVDQKA